MPSRTLYEVTYRLQRVLRPGRRKRWPSEPRINEYERMMHVNEQTLGSLKRYVRNAGFTGARSWLGKWIYTDFVPDERAKRLYERLAKLPVLDRFGIADLFASGVKA
jgi:hypothetical protein